MQLDVYQIFDLLPVHPGPGDLESLVGYVARIGDANGLGNSPRIQELFEPRRTVRRTIFVYPLPRWSHALKALGLSEEQLLHTTVHSLGRKLGHTTTSQSLHTL